MSPVGSTGSIGTVSVRNVQFVGKYQERSNRLGEGVGLAEKDAPDATSVKVQTIGVPQKNNNGVNFLA